MSLRYLLDTNVLSEPARPEPDAGVVARLEKHQHQVCTAAPVWNELLYGCRRLPVSKRRDHLERYLGEILEPSLEILPYDAAAADWHAAERARISLLGKTPAFIDGQIAAVARVHGLILVTRNLDDFASFNGLAVESWVQSSF